jgi:hypothetical protein
MINCHIGVTTFPKNIITYDGELVFASTVSGIKKRTGS